MDDDDSSDASESRGDEGALDPDDPDARDEQHLFADPYRRAKRQRRKGKEGTMLGVFAEDEGEEEEVPSRLSGGRKPKYTK